jgi:hypothetical protein
MKSIVVTVPLSGCLALGLAGAGCIVTADGASDPSTQETTSRTSSPGGPVDQAKIAQTTLKLENQFTEQFANGRIEREALQGAIDDVIQAMPEEARPKVEQHIADVLAVGDKLVSEMTAEQRAAVTTPPSNEQTGEVHDTVVAWGWPGAGTWGGYGAFAFPTMYFPYGYGAGLALGYNPWSGCGFASCGGGLGYPGGYW